MVASSSGATSGRSASPPRSSSGASASSSGCSTGSATVGIVQPPASSRLARRLVGDDQLGLGQRSSAVAHLVGLPPAVDQGGDPARLQHRHVGDDPGRAVAHRDGDAVALGDVPARRPAPAPAASPARSSSAKVSRSSPATTASTAPCSAQKASNRPGRVGGRLATIARPFGVARRAGCGRPRRSPRPAPRHTCGRARSASCPSPALPFLLPPL